MGGRYQVDRLIGRGGMGLVYLGRELLEDRELVLKMLAPHWADDPSAVGRFEREGKRLSELRHPNIVELFDIGHQDDHPYIVMEFIRGIPLRKILNRKGRLTPAEFLPIAAQLLDAVGYAHDKGVMLRDIKPSNVMLIEHEGKANYVKVLDFGLAKMVDGDDVEITKTNVIGTAGFLAPELIRGGEVDVRVDVYALSIMFFMMLTGSSPILGENDGAILYNHVHGTPRAFEDALPEGAEVPKALQDFIYKGMAKDTADRHANAGAMLVELRTLADAEAFELPSVTSAAKAEVERYWERKYEGIGLGEDDPSSSLWTRPRLEKLLEGDAEGAEAVAASNADPYGSAPKSVDEVLAEEASSEPDADKPSLVVEEPGAPRSLPPQPSAAIRAKTSGGLKAAPRSGSPALGSEIAEPPLPPPNARRPKPARTAASSNMARPLPGPPPRRHTLPASSGPANPPPIPATPAPKAKPSVTEVPTPQPMAAPSPLDGDNEVGPLHLELEAPPRRKKPRPPGSRSTLPIGSLAAPLGLEPDPSPQPEPELEPDLDEEEIELVDIDVDEDDDDPQPEPVAVEPDVEPITDPIAPVTKPPPPAVSPIMHAAEPAPPKRGIGTVLALSVGAALLLGGVVTWLALRSPSDSDPVASASETKAAAAGPAAADDSADDDAPAPVDSKPAASAAEVAGADDPDPGVDPDAPGTIKVEGPDGAKAFINDEAVGSVPASVSRPPGLYKIRVEARGFEDWSTEVQLQPDGHAKLVAANAAKSGSSRPTSRRRPGGSRPDKRPDATPEPTPEPKPEPKQDPPSQPKADPPEKKNPPSGEDDVFMKRGDKKDDGIFLPVGK